jgi:hypothetical protein
MKIPRIVVLIAVGIIFTTGSCRRGGDSSVVIKPADKGTIKGVLVSTSGAPMPNEEICLCAYSAQSLDSTKDMLPNQRIQVYDRQDQPAGILWIGDKRSAAILQRNDKVLSSRTNASGAFVLTGVPKGSHVISIAGYFNAVGRSMDCQLVPMGKEGMPQVLTISDELPGADVGKIAIELKK